MKPDKRARYAAAITLSKGKMYEYGVPEADHLAIPEDLQLEMQFPLALGTLGDFASEAVTHAISANEEARTPRDEVVFAAQVLQAFDESQLNTRISFALRVLSAAGFYLGDIPGNAAVLVSKLLQFEIPPNDHFSRAALAALDKPWNSLRDVAEPRAAAVLQALAQHFRGDGEPTGAINAIRKLREWSYAAASSHELLMADLLGAVSAGRIANSAWTLMPNYSELPPQKWRPYLSRLASIKEMWPSQRMLGEAGLYRGQSSVVQMPTSTGKSRATELIIRSAFLSDRTRLALVIAPFRALCQEIASDLEKAFRDDGYNVNQLSDALQPDFDIFDVGVESQPQVVVVTPEKLLYIQRQDPDIVQNAGLVVYDEGHQFDTGTRGVTYELLLTSIKRLLPESAQTVLISAVIQNAASVAAWLLKDKARVVSDKALQARRLIAFASLPHDKDGQLQFNVASETEQRFFVPRVIVQEKQPRRRRERKDRFFPTSDSGSIALYLGLRVVANGGVAIYAGRKASAAKIVRDAVEETFGRGISFAPPSSRSNGAEITRFVHLYEENFGAAAYLTKAAALGIFAHHGNTPQGVRLAIEYAMRHRLICLIVCTSTLAQGVNLPIRYLLVTSPMQGRESIRPRDFHNLMGRAGRAGMYGEGTVIFTDHRLFDERLAERFRWNNTVALINPDSAEPTGSTLLSLVHPLRNDTRTLELTSPTPAQIADFVIDQWERMEALTASIATSLQGSKFTESSLREQLHEKKKIVEAVESFLMTYRGDVDSETFVANARGLASETLAYSLASIEQQGLLTTIFETVARRVERLASEPAIQHRFGRTLLGIDHALEIDAWVADNFSALADATSAEDLFESLWPILTKLSDEKRVNDTAPKDAVKSLAAGWLAGRSFATLLEELEAVGACYPYGKQTRSFDIDLVVELCEQAFGFEFALLLAAVKESFAARLPEGSESNLGEHVDLLQKRLKYGLPNAEAIAYFEAGFSERVIAQVLSVVTFDTAATIHDVRTLCRNYSDAFAEVLLDYPSYFTDVLRTIVAPSAE